LKILITGVYSCGKTTLVNELVSEISRARFGESALIRDDPARSCPLPLNKDQTLHSSTWMAGQVIRNESEVLAALPDWVICDRGLPDILSHSYDLVQDPSELSTLTNLAVDWMKTYDFVFRAYPDPNRPISADRLRLDEPDYRDHLDQLLTLALAQCDVEYIDLPHDLEGRIAKVLLRVGAPRLQT
jgi:predicted ATPase